MHAQVLITFQPSENISRALMEATSPPPTLSALSTRCTISVFSMHSFSSPCLCMSPLQPLTLTFHCRETLSSAAMMQPSLLPVSPGKACQHIQSVRLSQIVKTAGVRAPLTLVYSERWSMWHNAEQSVTHCHFLKQNLKIIIIMGFSLKKFSLTICPTFDWLHKTCNSTSYTVWVFFQIFPSVDLFVQQLLSLLLSSS